jgi:hypothetical protein
MLALALSGCSSFLGPTAPDGNWHVITRNRFTFYVRPASFGEQSVDALSAVLDDQFAVSVQRLNLRYDGRITVFLHSSGADAGFGNDAGGGDHSGVAYPQTETVKTVAVPPLDGNLMSLVSHEVNHVIVANGLGRPGTTFINEGLASALLSERYHALGPSFQHRWVATHRSQVPRLSVLIDDEQWRNVPQATAYTSSASFLAYLIETHGPGPIRAVFPVASGSFANAFQAAFGLTLQDAETAWLLYCDAQR